MIKKIIDIIILNFADMLLNVHLLLDFFVGVLTAVLNTLQLSELDLKNQLCFSD